MIKIFLTVRNRFGITKKCIQALKKHSTLEHQIYVYDNLTNYRLEEHFYLYYKLIEKKMISQVTFNTRESCFDAFSKGVSNNQFGKHHDMDPRKLDYDFLLMLDNDVIVLPDWDIKIKKVWKDIKNKGLDKQIKVVTQNKHGGIMHKKKGPDLAGFKTTIGQLGGSAFWAVQPNFFDDVGFLNINNLVGLNKKHDQHYWRLLAKSSGSGHYIVGIIDNLVLHFSNIAGSVCNVLASRGDKKEETIKFKNKDNLIDSMDFDSFLKWGEDKIARKDWG